MSETRLKALEAKIENVLYENIHSVRGDVAGRRNDALSLILQALKTELEARIKELEKQRDEALNQLDSEKYSVSVLERRVAKLKEGET